ncbi:GNAT family N-acetyltransferase [Bacteroidota bacterium]
MTETLLTGSRIRLRALEPEDLEWLYEWENETEIWNISETFTPVSRYILKKYLENAHKDIFETKQLRLMIEVLKENISIGTIDLFDFDHFHKRAGIGILIADKSQRKKGYAAESIELIKTYCFELLKLNQLYCSISVDNKSSLELFEGAGFKITGRKEKWDWNGTGFKDVFFLQLIR